MNPPVDQKSGRPEASAIQPLAARLGELPGRFAIRTYLKDTFLRAREGGGQSINAVTTDATGVGQPGFERFTLTAFQPDFTTIQTLFNNFVSALGGGGSTNATQALQTLRLVVADDALFRFVGPDRNGLYTIGTLNDHFLTALGGGGKATDAFHTDATTASTWEKFRLIKCRELGSGYTYAIVQTGVKATSSPSNQYLNAIDGGGRATQAMTAFGDLGSNARFKLIGLADGSFAIQAPDGIHYVTADDGGGLEGENALLTNQTHIQAWEIFKIVDSSGDHGVYTIQTISGSFLGIGQGQLGVGKGVISTRISNPAAAPQHGYNATFELIPVGLIKQSP